MDKFLLLIAILWAIGILYYVIKAIFIVILDLIDDIKSFLYSRKKYK